MAVPCVLAICALVVVSVAASAQIITASQAAEHVGEEQTVCGVVASAKYAESSNGKPTFLNLDRPYPRHVFTALIWGEDRPRFSEPPERAFKDRSVCVSGWISSYRGHPQIVVRDPAAISVSQPPDPGAR
jgi:DNA/RNA endonuclease YhcR with UshA esterase domain